MVDLSTTVRLATEGDLPALARRLGERDVAALVRCGHTLVLTYGGGEIAGAAHLYVDGARGVLDLLVADAVEIENRLVAVADAVCTAYGCRLDIVPATKVPGSGCAAGDLRGPSIVAAR